MTTIVFRNGILAADTRAYSGNKNPIGQKTKIFHNPELKIACGTSTSIVGFGELFWKWLKGEIEDKVITEANTDDGFTTLVIKDDEVFLYDNSIHPTGPLTADYFAIGSGREYALGALEMGASALEAVRVGCVHDTWSAEPIMAIDLQSNTSRSIGAAILKAMNEHSGQSL